MKRGFRECIRLRFFLCGYYFLMAYILFDGMMCGVEENGRSHCRRSTGHVLQQIVMTRRLLMLFFFSFPNSELVST